MTHYHCVVILPPTVAESTTTPSPRADLSGPRTEMTALEEATYLALAPYDEFGRDEPLPTFKVAHFDYGGPSIGSHSVLEHRGTHYAFRGDRCAIRLQEFLRLNPPSCFLWALLPGGVWTRSLKKIEQANLHRLSWVVSVDLHDLFIREQPGNDPSVDDREKQEVPNTMLLLER